MTCGDLIVVKQVGAAVVSDPGSIRAESQFKVHERASGDYWKHTCKAKMEDSKCVQLYLIHALREMMKTVERDSWKEKAMGGPEKTGGKGNLEETKQKETD